MMMKKSGKSVLACHKNTKVSFLTAFLFLLISYILCASGEAAVRYVDWSATTGANNGTSWDDAYIDLQSAIAAALSGDEIWVAAGTYKPGTLRTSTFQLKNNVAIYGGFNGTEASLSQRNPATNVTILSGDIGTAGNNSDNSYHVVTGSFTNSTAILDGFTITGGNANGGIIIYQYGGGMLNVQGSPTLTNLIFSQNSANLYGGGMENITSSNPTLTNVTFSGNTSNNTGGGMDNDSSNPTLTNVTFSGNTATNSGGGIFNSSNSRPTLSYVTFSGNTATNGGGIFNLVGGTTCNSCILWNNTGGEISGAAATVSYSTVQGGYAGTGNSSLDPLLGTLGNYGGYTQTIPLLSGSPAINTIPFGTNGCGTTITTDQRGVTRPEGSSCDMGAYEFIPPAPAAVPTMNEWGMIIFMILAGLGAARYLSRPRRA